jgi:hypothetical protein
MQIFKKEFPDLPGLDTEIDSSNGEERSVSCSVTQEQIQGLKAAYGIDVEAMVTNVITNETYFSISKEISKKIFSGENYEDIKELEKFLDNDDLEGYLITNVAIGALMFDYSQFLASPIESITSSGSMYLAGTFKKLKVYIDSMLCWDDKRLAIFNKNFFNFKAEDENLAIVVDGHSAPKIVAKIRIRIDDPQSKVYTVNNAYSNENINMLIK